MNEKCFFYSDLGSNGGISSLVTCSTTSRNEHFPELISGSQIVFGCIEGAVPCKSGFEIIPEYLSTCLPCPSLNPGNEVDTWLAVSPCFSAHSFSYLFGVIN